MAMRLREPDEYTVCTSYSFANVGITSTQYELLPLQTVLYRRPSFARWRTTAAKSCENSTIAI